MRDREWHLQGSIKRLSPLPSAPVSCLEDFSSEPHAVVCVLERVIRALLIMWGLQKACVSVFSLVS